MQLVILLSALSSFAAAYKSYAGYKTYRVHAAEADRPALEAIGVDFWEDKLSTQGIADILLSPEQVASFEELGLDAQVMHEDLEQSIAEEASVPAQKRQADGSSYAQGYFERYHSYYEHLLFLYNVADQFANNSRVISAGTSYEGRPIQGLHIWGDGGGPDSNVTRPGMVFHSTVHAREWITTMVNEYIAYTMLSQYGVNENVTKYLNSADLYVFPLVNPDGFEYSQTEDRLWRKNRQPNTASDCVGTDENRNWAFEWNATNGAGSSTNPCSQTYRGEYQASTPENQALAAQLGQVRDNQGLLLYIDWHSYSQLFMYPFGYDCAAVVENPAGYASVAEGTSDAIEGVYGTLFDVGPICSTIYQVAGGSVDWAYAVGDAAWSFTFELRDQGNFGFVLPPSQILPSCEETFAGIDYLLGAIVP